MNSTLDDPGWKKSSGRPSRKKKLKFRSTQVEIFNEKAKGETQSILVQFSLTFHQICSTFLTFFRLKSSIFSHACSAVLDTCCKQVLFVVALTLPNLVLKSIFMLQINHFYFFKFNYILIFIMIYFYNFLT